MKSIAWILLGISNGLRDLVNCKISRVIATYRRQNATLLGNSQVINKIAVVTSDRSQILTTVHTNIINKDKFTFTW